MSSNISTQNDPTSEQSVDIEKKALTEDSVTAQATANAINKPVLKRGSTGPDVVELQKLLNHWGCYSGAFDGIFGAQTEAGVKKFQHRVFLKEDGIVGALTWQALYTGAPVNMPVVRRGSTGEYVKIIQTVLKKNNYYTGAIDGIFGQQTEAAVRNFQQAVGLTNDGIVGSRTWYALSKLPH